MVPKQFCSRCNQELEETVVDGQPTIVCWECQTTGSGYLAEEAGLAHHLQEYLGPREALYQVMFFIRMYRGQAQPFHQLLEACRDLLNDVQVMDDNELWSDVPTARVTEFAEAVAAAEVQA